MKAAANSHLAHGETVYYGSSNSWLGDKIHQPLWTRMLYQTGRQARIMPDGRLEFLEQGGRTIMREGLTGREVLDLYKLEQALEVPVGLLRQRPMYAMGKAIKLVLPGRCMGSY